MDGHGVMFAPSAEHPWRDVWPLVAQAGDGNAWVTGACWLYCRREGVAVLWVGSVATPGARGDVYACGPCIAELDHMVRVQSHHRDRSADRGGQPAAHTGHAHALPLHTEEQRVRNRRRRMATGSRSWLS